MLTLLTRLDAVKVLQHLLLKAQAAEKKAIQYLIVSSFHKMLPSDEGE